MGKQPVLAYSIAGVAVAIAIAVVASSTLGLTSVTGDSDQFVAGMAVDARAASVPVQSPGTQPGPLAAGVNAADVEYVYVDEPSAVYDEDDDDEEDDDEHERDGRKGHGHEDDDDD